MSGVRVSHLGPQPLKSNDFRGCGQNKKLNVNHPFYKSILQPLFGDLEDAEVNQEHQDIKNAILLLLFAYAKAESMFDNHEELFESLRNQWGTTLATALSEYDREVRS